jgi:hypothetical protein
MGISFGGRDIKATDNGRVIVNGREMSAEEASRETGLNIRTDSGGAKLHITGDDINGLTFNS